LLSKPPAVPPVEWNFLAMYDRFGAFPW
jgi:hypothetical protein